MNMKFIILILEGMLNYLDQYIFEYVFLINMNVSGLLFELFSLRLLKKSMAY